MTHVREFDENERREQGYDEAISSDDPRLQTLASTNLLTTTMTMTIMNLRTYDYYYCYYWLRT